MAGSSFRFRLERVRALRERNEDAAKQSLAEALRQQEVCRCELERAQDTVAAAQAAQLQAGGAVRTVADLLGHQAFLERAERAVEATRQDLEGHEREVAQRREVLSAAARERQALERLKEHRRADFEREVARREGLDLDEIAINGFRRRAA